MERKKIYNPNSDESVSDRRVFGGNPHGILNFTKAKYTWALKLWDMMEANTWFPKEVDTTKDIIDYNRNLLPCNYETSYCIACMFVPLHLILYSVSFYNNHYNIFYGYLTYQTICRNLGRLPSFANIPFA